jgi:hypothetical protein
MRTSEYASDAEPDQRVAGAGAHTESRTSRVVAEANSGFRAKAKRIPHTDITPLDGRHGPALAARALSACIHAGKTGRGSIWFHLFRVGERVVANVDGGATVDADQLVAELDGGPWQRLEGTDKISLHRARVRPYGWRAGQLPVAAVSPFWRHRLATRVTFLFIFSLMNAGSSDERSEITTQSLRYVRCSAC